MPSRLVRPLLRLWRSGMSESARCRYCGNPAPRACRFCGLPVCQTHASVWTRKHRGRWRDGQTRSRYAEVAILCRVDCGGR